MIPSLFCQDLGICIVIKGMVVFVANYFSSQLLCEKHGWFIQQLLGKHPCSQCQELLLPPAPYSPWKSFQCHLLHADHGWQTSDLDICYVGMPGMLKDRGFRWERYMLRSVCVHWKRIYAWLERGGGGFVHKLQECELGIYSIVAVPQNFQLYINFIYKAWFSI